MNRVLLPFQFYQRVHDGVELIGRPQRGFRPLGLAVYDAGKSEVCAFVGRDIQAVVSFGAVPSRFFNSDLSFEQIQTKLDAGILPPNWVTWDVAWPGFLVLLRFTRGASDKVQAVMWGEHVDILERFKP